jgi:hypothetical protein
VFRVLAFWWLYKRAKPFPSPLVFLEFLCQENCLHSQIGFFKCSRWLLHNHHLHTLHVHSFFAVQLYIRISFQPPLVHYIYICVCACIFFLLISFYFWLVLVFLFSRVSYGFTPLQHCMSRHYTSRHCWFSTWMVWCVIFQNVLFCKTIVMWGGAILTLAN